MAIKAITVEIMTIIVKIMAITVEIKAITMPMEIMATTVANLEKDYDTRPGPALKSIFPLADPR